MKLLILFSFCSCLALNACAQPPRCATPPLLVGSLGITGKDGTFRSFGQYAYDAVSEQIRFKDEGSFNNKPFSIDLLMHFKQGFVYEIDSTKSTCKKYKLKSTFHPMRIPTNAKFLGEVILGTSSIPQMGLQVTSWEGEETDIAAKYLLTFTDYTCLPVSAVVHTKEFGWLTVGFFNQLLGILDPMSFVPPSFCDTDAEANLPVTDFFSVLTSSK
ncbi:ependymin-like [Hoplias malabaricus]|uniref:ependymin-like n=1 Tax=Hoplias malabaricus TaxID=27720 RepID=UPI003462A4F2